MKQNTVGTSDKPLTLVLPRRGMVNPPKVLRFELDRGVPLEPQNPYPSLRVILAEKGTHFLRIFLEK